MLQLYGVALSAGKAHKDHKHHHAHHYEHDTTNNTPRPVPRPPVTQPPLPQNPYLTGGQINPQVRHIVHSVNTRILRISSHLSPELRNFIIQGRLKLVE